MPSFLTTNQSGGQPLYSGNPYSGQNVPIGGVQIVWPVPANGSGNLYVALSGNMTVNSGTLNGGSFDVGSGMLDGVCVQPGASYFVPKIGYGPSGNYGTYSGAIASGTGRVSNIHVMCDPVCSGQRVYFEMY